MNDQEILISKGRCWACEHDVVNEDGSNCECPKEPVKPSVKLGPIGEVLDWLEETYGRGKNERDTEVR